MLYTVLIYGVPGIFERLPPEEQERHMQVHRDLQARLKADNRLKSVAQLMPPATAMNVRAPAGEPIVLDGPYAETKEQLLGFYLVDCGSMDEALGIARALPQGIAHMEVRPVNWGEVPGAE